MKQYNRLSPFERDRLAIWKAEGVSNGVCAVRLRRNVSTIGRELKRNSWQGTHYVAIHAQGKAGRRETQKAHGKHELKNPDVYTYVTERLRWGWSPDQIAGRLRVDHPKDHYRHISTETIYRWIYQSEQVNGEQPWYEYLCRKQKKRKKYKGRKVHRSHIPDRISIHERPAVANKRKQFGHWEGDTIEGKGHKSGVHTEVERMCRKVKAEKVDSITSEATIMVQQKIFTDEPRLARRSTTLDNGRENHLHVRLRDTLGMKTYHADPYSSWQRGTNEHGNWHIRYYFPKGTDFTQVTDEELQDVIEEINNRPRKILGYLTANERYQQLLKKSQGLR